MTSKDKTKVQLIKELAEQRQRIAVLETSKTRYQQTEAALQRALQESQQHQTEISALLEGTRAVLKYNKFEEAARAIFDSGKDLIGATGGYVALLTPDGAENEVLFLDSGGRPCTVDPLLPMPIRGLRGEAYRTCKVVYNNDFAKSGWIEFLPDGHVTIDNVLFAPLVIEEKTVGLLGLANKPGGFTENDARLAAAFGEFAAIALFNSRILGTQKHSEERFRSVVQTASDAIISINSQGNIIFWNRAAESMFGYSTDEAVGKLLTLIIPDRLHEVHRQGVSRVVSGRESSLIGKTVELVGLRKNGSEFPLELSLATWQTKAEIFFTGIIRDITEHKQARESLQYERDFAESLIETAQVIVVLFDTEGRIMHFNRYMEEISGYRLAEVQGRDWFTTFLPEQDRERIRAIFLQAIADIQTQGKVNSIITRYGRQREIEWYDKTLKDAEGNLVGLLSIGHDVTDRIRGEEELRQHRHRLEELVKERTLELAVTNEQLRQEIIDRRQTEESLRIRARILESMAEGVNVSDENAVIFFTNPAFEAMFGYEPGELIGQHVSILNAGIPEESDQVALQILKSLKTRGVWSGELNNVKKDGTLFTTYAYISALEVSGKHYWVTVQEDITERKQAEEALLKSEERFRTLADFTYDWEYWIDPDGNYIYVSPSCERITEYRAGEFKQKPNLLELIVHPDDRPLVADHLHYELESDKVSSIDFRIITRSGHERWISHICQPVYADDGRHLGRRASNRDITERKQAEESLQQRNRDLWLLNRANQALIATLDLDQVLTTVLEETHHLLDVVAGSVWLIDSKTNELVCRRATGSQSQTVQGWRLLPEQGLAGWVAKTGQNLIVPDVQADPRYFKGIEQQTGLTLHSVLCVPLWSKQDVIGVIQVVDETVDRFDTTDMILLELLAATSSIAIENAQLYAQARHDAETRAILLHEVNHRVKNNLAAIIGLLYAERRYLAEEHRTAYKVIMEDLINRVQGLSTVHNMLSASEWSPLRLSELVLQIIQTALQTTLDKSIFTNVPDAPVWVTPRQANSLALVINELTTNTIKYALIERDTGHIAIHITLDDEMIELLFQDDGPGYPKEVLSLERHNVGLYLIQRIVNQELRGELTLRNDSGAVTVIRFKTQDDSQKGLKLFEGI